MHLRSFYTLLIASSIAFIAAVCVWTLTPEYSAGSFFGERLFPNLMERINETEVVSIEHNGETLTFLRNDNGDWTLMEANEYPADKERIRNILIGLSNLEKIEPKTALPEFYPDLQVEDASEKGKSYLVTLLDAEGEQLTSLLIGKNISGVSWNGQGYFVRFPNDAQSWLVRGNADVTGDKLTWLSSRILPLEKGRISSITLIDKTRTREIVFKRTSPETPLTPFFLSDRFFIASADFIEEMETALTSFDFKDVIQRPENLEEDTPVSSAMIETGDGLNIFMFLYLRDSKPYIAVSFDIGDKASEKVKKEAASLEAFHQKWLYLMDNEKIMVLLPFLPLPQEEPSKTNEKKEGSKKAAKGKASASNQKKASAKKK